MNTIFIILSILLPVCSLKQIKPKLCIHCKFFIPDTDSDKFSKCSLFQKQEGKVLFLINGIYQNEEFYFCSTARSSDNMCGEEGKCFAKKRRS